MNKNNSPYFYKFMLCFIGISGAFSVLCGAWLAHAGQTLPIESQTRLASALQYQFLHTISLFILITWLRCFHREQACVLLKLAAYGFVIGILLFSGSLYLKTLLGLTFIGKLAPFGGSILALSWLVIVIAGLRIK